jgi:hypothetical protein
MLLYFSGSSGSLMPALLSVENWVPLKPVLGGVALIHYPSCTDSIKPSLQFLCNFVMINASERSLCFQIFIIISKIITFLQSSSIIGVFKLRLVRSCLLVYWHKCLNWSLLCQMSLHFFYNGGIWCLCTITSYV